MFWKQEQIGWVILHWAGAVSSTFVYLNCSFLNNSFVLLRSFLVDLPFLLGFSVLGLEVSTVLRRLLQAGRKDSTADARM